jgi:hypothetical protein
MAVRYAGLPPVRRDLSVTVHETGHRPVRLIVYQNICVLLEFHI